LRKNLVQSFQQTLGDEFTFQQDNNLKHQGQIYTGVVYQEDSEDNLGDEFTFQQDNNLQHQGQIYTGVALENRLENGCRATINNQQGLKIFKENNL
jgi:hypothetical protein